MEELLQSDQPLQPDQPNVEAVVEGDGQDDLPAVGADSQGSELRETRKVPEEDDVWNPNDSEYTIKKVKKSEVEFQEKVLGIRESRLQPFIRNIPLYFKKRTVTDLKRFRPTQLQFLQPHPQEERKDDWFETQYQDLFERVEDFAQYYFATAGTPDSFRDSAWLDNYSPQFIEYASAVSRQDPVMGGWEEMLRSKITRSYLVMGIVSKVLENHVFSSLLFGADEEQTMALEAHDEATVGLEGYTRTSVRSGMVRDLLAGSRVAPNFWPAVDALAAQTTALLIPLQNFQGRVHVLAPWKSTKEMYQKLHHIVAAAAYLATAMRWSRSVFDITFPELGQIWDLNMETADHKIFEASRKKALALDDAEAKVAEDRARAAGELPQPGKVVKHIGPLKKISFPVENMQASGMARTRPVRAGKVQIILWPTMKRYKPVGEVDTWGATKGEIVVKMFKAKVVYSYGVLEENDKRGSAERYPLEDHVRVVVQRHRRARMRRDLKRAFYGIVAILIVASLIANLLGIYRSTAPTITGKLTHGYEELVRSWQLCANHLSHLSVCYKRPWAMVLSAKTSLLR